MGGIDTRIDDYFYMQAYERLAARRVYKRHNVTARELNMLCGLSAVLRIKGKRVISKDLLLDWIGGNRRFNEQGWYYLRCLIDKGALLRLKYNNVPDHKEGNSLAISAFGIRVLESFENELRALATDHIPGTFSDLLVQPDQLPFGYKAIQAGRD